MENKVVFVTGSSHGIGKEIVLAAATEKARVVVTYFKDRKAGQKVAKECKELGAADVLLLKLNVKSTASIKESVERTVKKFKKIDVLINNAGITTWEPLKQLKYSQIEDQIRTNLEGLIKMTKKALPHVKETIINISSGAGQTGYADLTVYSATKFGIRGFTQALAQEAEHLNVYVVNPGKTATRMTGFRGDPAPRVAAPIIGVITGKIKSESGSDINLWDIIE